MIARECDCLFCSMQRAAIRARELELARLAHHVPGEPPEGLVLDLLSVHTEYRERTGTVLQ